MKDFKGKVSKDKQKKITIFHGLCKGCGICIEKCPFKAISFDKNELGVYSTPSVKFDLDKCNLCKLCEIHCPDSAIRVEKEDA